MWIDGFKHGYLLRVILVKGSWPTTFPARKGQAMQAPDRKYD